MAAKLKKHEENAIEILREFSKLRGDGGEDDFSKGWDEALNETTKVVERVTGISMEDAIWREGEI